MGVVEPLGAEIEGCEVWSARQGHESGCVVVVAVKATRERHELESRQWQRGQRRRPILDCPYLGNLFGVNSNVQQPVSI